MRALVTGGAGFIGSHLVWTLLDRGHEVIAIDNLSAGRIENLAEAPNHDHLHFHRADVADLPAIVSAFQGVDWVFHLAALADIVPSISDPLSYHRSNVDGTVAVLEAARTSGVRRFIYAASASCYGFASELPTSEAAEINPQYPYALTKYVGEQYVLHWAQVYKLPAVSLRLFNVYGPRARTTGAYGAVFGVFLAQKLHGLPFTVVGDGSQTRDFTFVSDVVEAMLAAAESDVVGEIMNVGSGEPHSVNELVGLLTGPLTYLPKRPGEPDCTVANIAKVRRLLGWEPRVPFEQGVGIMLEHIEYWRDAPVWTPEAISAATADWFGLLDAERGGAASLSTREASGR